MTTASFPFDRTVEPLTNDPHYEFVLDCVDGLPPARQKRIILRARDPQICVLTDAQAELMIDALGLRGA